MQIEVVMAERGAITITSKGTFGEDELVRITRKAANILSKFERSHAAPERGVFGFGPPECDE